MENDDRTRSSAPDPWPPLPLAEWRDTYATLHMLTQIVGKVRLARAPMVNHWWQVALYVSTRGLTTSPIPDGERSFQIDFDFLDHRLVFQTDEGGRREVALESKPVARYYGEITTALKDLAIDVDIWPSPVEIEDPIPFPEDRTHSTYVPEHAYRFWRVLAASERVLTEFRSRFVGKCSPVHFFWGSFDLAVTRFSGRRAPAHPGGVPHLADRVTREAYSRECSSAGFWPGGGAIDYPAFYSYAYPEPEGYADSTVHPAHASYNPDLREFILPYDAVRAAPDPEPMLLDFFQSTYEAAAGRGRWDRHELEADYPAPGEPIAEERAGTFPTQGDGVTG